MNDDNQILFRIKKPHKVVSIESGFTQDRKESAFGQIFRVPRNRSSTFRMRIIKNKMASGCMVELKAVGTEKFYCYLRSNTRQFWHIEDQEWQRMSRHLWELARGVSEDWQYTR